MRSVPYIPGDNPNESKNSSFLYRDRWQPSELLITCFHIGHHAIGSLLNSWYFSPGKHFFKLQFRVLVFIQNTISIMVPYYQ